MLIVSVDDFKGFHDLSLDSQKREDLDAFINRYETFYLNQLLGPDSAALFIANLDDGKPASAPFKKIFEPLVYEGCQSKGIMDIILSLVYYHFISSDQAKHTLSGVTQRQNENSENKTFDNANRMGEQRWNDAGESWDVIQNFICDNKGTYEGFDGQELPPKYSAIL